MSKALLLKFRETNSEMGVNRDTLKEISEKLGVSETMAIHIAIARLRRDLFDDNDEFDFPSEHTLAKLNKASKKLSASPVVRKKSILDRI